MKKYLLGAVLLLLGLTLLICADFNFVQRFFQYEREIRNIVEILPPDQNFQYRVWVEISPGVEKLVKVGKWLDEPEISYVHDLKVGERSWLYLRGRRPLSGEVVLEYLEIHTQKNDVPKKNPERVIISKGFNV